MSTINKALIRLHQRSLAPVAEPLEEASFEQVILGAGQIISYSATFMPPSSLEGMQAKSVEVGIGRREDRASPMPAPHLAPRSFQGSRELRGEAVAVPLQPLPKRIPLPRPPSSALAGANADWNEALVSGASLEPGMDGEPTLEPAWELDTFAFPPDCESLRACKSQELAAAAKALAQAAATKGKVIVVTSLARQAGVSTLTLCLARELAETCRVALVEADLEQPCLARRLKFSLAADWISGAATSEHLSETAITDLTGRLVIFPLRQAPEKGALPGAQALANVLHKLGAHYDVVLVDAGPLAVTGCASEPAASGANSGVSLAVRDMRHTSDEEFGRYLADLAAAGLPPLGVLENFDQAETLAS